MNESEWLAEKLEPQDMLSTIRGIGQVPRTKKGRRQLRLVACGCCRLLWDDADDPQLEHALETAERFADGKASRQELTAAEGAMERIVVPSLLGYGTVRPRTVANVVFAATRESAVSSALEVTAFSLPLVGTLGSSVEARTLVCNLLRDIFGNPFRPVPFDPAWRTSTAVAIARGMYSSRDFSAMPILADALQDAGCDNDDVLQHCRAADGVHVRGCWVVDLILEKA